MKDPVVLDALITGLDSDSVEMRIGTALALAHHPSARAFDALMARCRKRNFAFRWHVGEAIGLAQNRHFIPMMLAAVREGADWRVQEVSVVALTQLQGAVGIDPLLHSLKSDDKYIRKIACWNLGRIGDPRAIDALINDMLRKYDTYTLRVWGWAAIRMISRKMDRAMQEQERKADGTNWAAAELAVFEQWWSAHKQRYLERE